MRLFIAGALVSALLISGCGAPLTSPMDVTNPTSHGSANYNFNRPFITVDETLQLYYGMTPSSVLSACGKPLFVYYGSRDLVVWVYEVREIAVGAPMENWRPVKSSEIQDFAGALHYLGLAFAGNSLSCWGPVNPGHSFDKAIFGDALPAPASAGEEEGGAAR